MKRIPMWMPLLAFLLLAADDCDGLHHRDTLRCSNPPLVLHNVSASVYEGRWAVDVTEVNDQLPVGRAYITGSCVLYTEPVAPAPTCTL